MNRALLLLILILGLLRGAAQETGGGGSGHLLGVGDRISYRVEEDGEPAVNLIVSDAGELDIPLIGRLKVIGKSSVQIVQEIKPKLERDFYQKATIHLSIEQVNPNGNVVKVYLTGEVKKTGPQEFLVNEKMTASRIILKAGGFADFANTRKVKIVRQDAQGKTTSFEVDLKEVLEGGKVELDPEVKDGDLIIVPQKLVRF